MIYRMLTHSLDKWYLVGAQPVEANDGKLQEETSGFSLESMTLNKLRLNASALSPFFLAATYFVSPTQVMPQSEGLE